MSTTIVGKLNKDARQFQAGESTGFSVRLGVKFRDPKTKQDEWTNYQAVIFAKAPGQIQFYQNVLVKDSVIEVTADQLKVDSFDGDNGPILSIDMLNARVGYVHTGDQPQQQGQGNQQQHQSQQQGGYGQQQQQSPQQQGGYGNQQGQQQHQDYGSPQQNRQQYNNQNQQGYNPNQG